MFRYLEELRRKPEHVRHTSAVILTVCFFVIILGVWISVDAPMYVGGGASEATAEHSEGSTQKGTSPFTQLTDTLRNARTEFNAMVGEVRQAAEAFNTRATTSSTDASTTSPPANSTRTSASVRVASSSFTTSSTSLNNI